MDTLFSRNVKAWDRSIWTAVWHDATLRSLNHAVIAHGRCMVMVGENTHFNYPAYEEDRGHWRTVKAIALVTERMIEFRAANPSVSGHRYALCIADLFESLTNCLSFGNNFAPTAIVEPTATSTLISGIAFSETLEFLAEYSTEDLATCEASDNPNYLGLWTLKIDDVAKVNQMSFVRMLEYFVDYILRTYDYQNYQNPRIENLCKLMRLHLGSKGAHSITAPQHDKTTATVTFSAKLYDDVSLEIVVMSRWTPCGRWGLKVNNVLKVDGQLFPEFGPAIDPVIQRIIKRHTPS